MVTEKHTLPQQRKKQCFSPIGEKGGTGEQLGWSSPWHNRGPDGVGGVTASVVMGIDAVLLGGLLLLLLLLQCRVVGRSVPRGGILRVRVHRGRVGVVRGGAREAGDGHVGGG